MSPTSSNNNKTNLCDKASSNSPTTLAFKTINQLSIYLKTIPSVSSISSTSLLNSIKTTKISLTRSKKTTPKTSFSKFPKPKNPASKSYTHAVLSIMLPLGLPSKTKTNSLNNFSVYLQKALPLK
jgi:hypothetical protein